MAQLNGTSYTIDSATATGGTNFQGFQDLVDTLNAAGVTGPVEVSVVAASGPFTEPVEFKEVTGASATNTITINGNGSSIKVEDNYVFWLNGADHFHFDNFILENENSTMNQTFVVIFGNDADSNSVTNSELIISEYDLSNTSRFDNVSAYVCLLSSDEYSTDWQNPTNVTNATGNDFSDNKMWNGSGDDDIGPTWGIYMEGALNDYWAGTGFTVNNSFDNNEIIHTRVGVVYDYYGQGDQFTNNTIGEAIEANNYYGFYMYYAEADPNGNNIKINDNLIQNVEARNTSYGIYNFYCKGLSQDEPYEVRRNTIQNFELTNGTFYGIYNYGSTSTTARFQGRNIHTDRNLIQDNQSGTSRDRLYGIYSYVIKGYFGITNNSIINNKLGDAAGAANQYGIYNYGSEDNFYAVNNTVYWADSANWSSGIYWQGRTEVDSVVIANNVVVDASATVNAGNSKWILGAEIRGSLKPKIVNNNIYTTNSNNIGNGVVVPNRIRVMYTNTGYLFDDNWTNLGFGSESAETDPDLTDPTNGDIVPQNVAIANTGLPGYTTEDVDGDSRTACGPDPGAQEYFVDFSAANLVHVTTADICGNTQPDITIDLVNPYADTIFNGRLYYSLNSGDDMIERVDTADKNASTNYMFMNPPSLNKPGANSITVGIYCDDNDANNTITQTFNVVPVPSGGRMTASTTTFEGYEKSGTLMAPDVTVNGYVNKYDISAPTQSTFAGGTLGTDFTYSISATTDNGTDVTSLGFTLSGSEVSVDPSTNLSDSTVFVEVTVTSVSGGCDTSFGRWVYIPHTPAPSFTYTDVCLGDVSEFRNTSTLLGDDFIVTHWEFNDPSGSVEDFSDIKDGFWTYEQYGSNIPVDMTVSNGVYPKFQYTLTETINVTPKPLANFKVINACEEDDITILNNTDLPTGITGTITYSWDFGGEQTFGNIATPSYEFTTPGQRTIKMTASANGCDAVLEKNAYQFELPTARFESLGECNFVDVEFANGSTIENGANMGYAWDFNGEGQSRIKDPSFAFATPGDKTITLVATSEFGCDNSITKTVTLKESPEADFAIDRACNLTPINFTVTGSVPDGGVNSSYAWDFNGEDVSQQADPSYLFNRVGTKMVTLTIEDLNGCASSITKPIEVVLQSISDFEAQDVCDGDEAVFTNKSTVAAGDLTYVWTFGDGNTSTDLAGKHTYAEAKVYNVTLEAIVEGGCSDEITKQVVVQPSPDASFTSGKDGRQLNITGPAGNDQYRWTFGNGGSSREQSPTYVYSNVDNGTFEVCLATRKGDCWSESCETITVDLAGVAELTENNDMINVYPNPTNGRFTVSIENAGNSVIKVGDILGNVLDVKVEDKFDGTFAVDMSAVADGVYFVQVKNGDFYATKRITISK